MMLSLRGALRTGGGISLRQNVSLFHSTASKSSTSSEPSIEIPQRVERSPTDILEALASTVSRDYTAPDYKASPIILFPRCLIFFFQFHDDPWLAPYKTSSKRDYALAKEAGRKSARYILNKHPDLFHHNRIYAEPPITAFQPRAAYNRDNVTLELLDNLVSSYQVTDAINVYNILKEKKKELPEDLKQRLLEVVAFHNEEEAEEEGYEARGALRADSLQWKSGGLAEQLYSDGGAASPQARLALLLGYAKFGNKKGALQMWEECKANKDPLPLEAYHAYINSVNMRGVEKNIVIVKEILSEIQSAGLKPNTETLVSVLKLLSSTSQGPEHQQSCKYALDCVAEFKEAGVTISLGVYKMLLDIFVDLKSQQKNMILVDIMLALEGQDMWPASSLEDFYFFQRAQQVAMYLNRPKLAWQINELLLTGNNIALLAHMSSEAAYYNQFLQNILQNDSFDQSMELYYKVTPHLWSPTGQYYRNLLSALHSHGAVQHLGKVFDDMVLSNYGGSNKETCNELNYQVMQILERNEPSGSEFTGLSEVWTNIAKRIFDHLESNKDNRNFGLRFNLSAVKMCSLCITVQLREAGWEEAARTFRFCLEQTTVMPGQLDDPVLKALMEQSVSLKDQELALEIATYAQTMGSQGAIALGLAVSDGFELGPSQKEYLNKLFATEAQWKPI